MSWCHFAWLIELAQSPANENHGLNVAEHPNKLFLVELKSFHWSSKLLSFFLSKRWQTPVSEVKCSTKLKILFMNETMFMKLCLLNTCFSISGKKLLAIGCHTTLMHELSISGKKLCLWMNKNTRQRNQVNNIDRLKLTALFTNWSYRQAEVNSSFYQLVIQQDHLNR